MNIQTIDIRKLKQNPSNPRLIRDDKYKKLVASIREFPQMLQIRPIVVDSDFMVLGGNMRLRACEEAGLKEVHVIKADELTEDQKRRFIIADNVGYGEWNWEALANEWDAGELADWGVDLPGFEFDGTELGTDFSLPDGDKAPFQQMTFTLADAQAELIKQALKDVEVQDGTQYGNENSNGNALHQIVLEWAEQRR
jgi:hypothetical protein